VSDHQGPAVPPAAGYAAYLLVRGLWGLISESKLPAPAPSVAKRAIVTPPPAATAAVTPPAPPPVVRWTGGEELAAWRAWRLAILLDEDVDQIGPRLLSLSTPCIWDGPAVRAHTSPSVHEPGGIYAVKRAVVECVPWRRNEQCWITGWVALSGRVLEHERGYRAERAVVRELRLGVGTHLAVRRLDMLRNVMGRLEDRYQAPVDVGHAEREVADRMLMEGLKPECPELPLMFLRPPWHIV